MKNWYESKLVWNNICISLIGIFMLIADYWTRTPALTVPGIATLLAGAVGVILRVWFTDQPISHA
jgi:hypothetical protein